jgi:SET domain-containing protein 6
MVPRSRAGDDGLSRPRQSNDTDSDDDDTDDEIAVMVPMADMLNAAYEMDNARLYGDDDDDEDQSESGSSMAPGYTMTTVKPVTKGHQIVRDNLDDESDSCVNAPQYNTYASPPNSELLRKYGHTDALHLNADLLSHLTSEEVGGWPFGNPGDEVEIQGDDVVRAVIAHTGGIDAELRMSRRIDWWLDEDQDE